MSHAGREDQGTGLRGVFQVLAKAPLERLSSVVLQLGDSPEDRLVQALCLIRLQKGEQALEKLQTLRDNPLAKHLAEAGCANGGELDDFGAQCGQIPEQTGQCLSWLARIFKVLSEQKMCEESLRNLAYKRALSSDCFKTNSCGSLEYHQLVEEAKVVCGPQFVDLLFEHSPDLNTSLNEEKTTLKESLNESAHICCLPSPLQESPSEPSYPTHLEISIPSTVSFQGDKRASEASGNSSPNSCILVSEHEAKHEKPPPPEPNSNESLSESNQDSKPKEAFDSVSSKLHDNIAQNESPNQLSTETFTLQSPQNLFLPKTPFLKTPHGTEAEEEEIFYTFVILHAPEDEELAERMKEKIETAVGSKGATFSEEFAVPGKSTLKCVEDAIDNSAFTFLLLTRNFNTRMLEVKTNMALINSINKAHKFNSVIPLMPEDNCMPREGVPRVLQTLVSLDEKRNFTKKLQKALSPAMIKKQRKKWAEEQNVRRLRRLNHEADGLGLYMQQLLSSSATLEHEGANSRALWGPQPNIHIQNAKYIMIGNDSTMTVDTGRNANNDGSL